MESQNLCHSPLQLDEYFVNELSFKVNPKFEEPVGGTSKVGKGMTLHCQMRVSPDSPRRGYVRLTFDLPEIDSKELPYFFRLTIEGFFSVDESQADKFENLLRLAGVPMLYSTARQVLRSATAFSILEPLFLPTVSFLPPPNAERQSGPISKKETSKTVKSPRARNSRLTRGKTH